MCSTLQKRLTSNHINCECIPKEGKQQSVLCTNLGYKKKKKKILHWLHKASRFSLLVCAEAEKNLWWNVNFKSRDNVSQSNVWQSFLSLPLVSDSSCTIWMSAKDQNSHQSVIYSTNSECLLGLGLYVSVLWEPRRKK